MSLTAKMVQINESVIQNDDARVNVMIHLDTFNIDFQKEQFNCLIRILNHASNYQRFQFNYHETRKHKFFRPQYSITDKTNRSKIYNSSGIKNENCVMWWKYSINTVRKKIEYIKGK